MGKTGPGQKQGDADQQVQLNSAARQTPLAILRSSCTQSQAAIAVLRSWTTPARNLPHGGPHHWHMALGARQSSQPQLGLIMHWQAVCLAFPTGNQSQATLCGSVQSGSMVGCDSQPVNDLLPSTLSGYECKSYITAET